MKTRYIWTALPLLLLLAACQITKPYQRPEAPLQQLYRDSSAAAAGADTTGIAGIPRAEFFADKQLQSLIERGLSQNLDLKIAVQRILAASASLQQTKAAFLPELNGNATIRQSRLSFPQGFGIIKNSTQYEVGLSAAWEVDVWGKLSSAKRSALAGLLQTEAARRAVQTRLVADIAGTYYQLLALDEQLIIIEKTVANRKEDAETMKTLKNANVVNGAAVVQSEANQYAAEVVVPQIRRQIRETENALNLLLANPPGPVQRATLASQQLKTDLSAGVPAQLLQRRPDVMAAEYGYRSAFENTNVARASFYPSLNITAATGFSTYTFSDWFTPAGFFANVAGGLAQPILNRGQNKARLRIAKAQQEEALYRFQQSLYVAGKEVSDALYAWQTAVEQQTIRAKQLQSLEKSVDFTKKLLRYSAATNYTDVLTSEQNLLTAQLDDISDRLQQWQAVVNLYRALGGGWDAKN